MQRYLQKYIPIYRLKDYNSDPVQATFYEPELQKIIFEKDQVLNVEQTIFGTLVILAFQI